MIQGSDSFRLIVRRGPQPNQSYELNKDIVTLGRDITNDIVINDPEVSRHHLRLTRGGGGFTIEDLGSTNGTFINGQRLTGARPLRPGDMVGLGETVTLAYEAGAAAAPGVGDGGQGTVASPVQRGAQQYQSEPQYGGGYQPPQQQQQSPYGQPQAPYSPASPAAPAPGGYEEYDPYAVREEEPRNTTRWVLIGCAGLTLFCCCSSVLGLVFVDQACLWDRIPVLYDVLRALGFTAVCT